MTPAPRPELARRLAPLIALVLGVLALFGPFPIALRLLLAGAYLALPLWGPTVSATPTGVRFITGRAPWMERDVTLRIMAAAALAVAAPGLLGDLSHASTPTLLGLVFGIPFAITAVLGTLRRMFAKTHEGSVLVERESVTVFEEPIRVVRYADLQKVDVVDKKVTLTVIGRGELEATTVEIMTGSARTGAAIARAIDEAWDAWRRAGAGAKSTTEVLLQKPDGLSARAWLERIDAMPVAKPGETDAYRGRGVDADALWSTLNDPAASADARAAAARLLHADDAHRVRVAEAVRVEADAETRARIEATLKPADEAAAELEALEAEATARDVGR